MGAGGACGATAGHAPQAGTVPSFRNDVMAVLAKGGCNSGGCHGNKNGKGGFKLSLRGQDPADDFAAISRDVSGRRINSFEPELSLLLLKPTGGAAHEGGKRFEKNSWEYEVLRDWIAANAPEDQADIVRLERLEVSPRREIIRAPEDRQRIRALARFSDGSSRDVTSQAVYEPVNPQVRVSKDGEVTFGSDGDSTILVRYLHLQHPVELARVSTPQNYRWEAPPVRNLVDEHVFRALRKRGIPFSGKSSDTEFLRRAYLDLLGRIPTVEEARSFIGEKGSRKRSVLVDRLLERPEFAEFWALKWADLFKAEEKALDRKGVQHFHEWLRAGIAKDKPLDQLAKEILSATGSTYENPAANFYRSNRTPIARAETAAQVFLGTRLQCAQCHNHPYDRWSQDDYYGWATLFARVGYKVLENHKKDGLDSHEFVGEQIVYPLREGELTNARTGKPARPKLLALAPGEGEVDPDRRLDSVADWISKGMGGRFAQVQANRIWYHMMGRGLVDPIDDFRPTNPSTHPELLEALSKDLAKHDFNLRRLIRIIMNSETYQRSSDPVPGNEKDSTFYSHVWPRRLAAEQLLDAQHDVLGVRPKFAGYPEGISARQLPGVSAFPRRELKLARADRFLKLFGKPERLLACECERSSETTLGQAFELITGSGQHDLLSNPKNRLGDLLDPSRGNGDPLTGLYWAALSRDPTEKERAAWDRHRQKTEPRAALEDTAWALLNSKEFLLRH